MLNMMKMSILIFVVEFIYSLPSLSNIKSPKYTADHR